MSGEVFAYWIASMKEAGLASSDADCARLLGVHRNSIANMIQRGCDRRTALACRALLHRLSPFGEE